MVDALPDARVLIVTSSWPRTGDEIAGTFVRTDAIARSRSSTVWVAAPSGEGVARTHPSIRVVDVPCFSAFGTPGALARIRQRPYRAMGLLAWSSAVSALANRVAPTTIVAHWMLPSGLLACSLAAHRREVVAHGGDVRMLERMPRIVARRIVEHLADRALLRAVSPALADRIASLAPGARDRLQVAPLPLDEETIGRARLGRCAKNELHVVAARLVREKRLERAIDWAHARTASLLVLGDGPDRLRLERHARELGASVEFAGAVPHEVALQRMATARGVLAPLAPGEGAPTVVREAHALGVPCEVFP